MKKLKVILIKIFILTQTLIILGCSSSSQPSDELIEKEFRHAWYSIHGTSGQKAYRWKLLKVHILKVTPDENGKKAKANILFTYVDLKNQTLDRRDDFVFYKKGDTWELEDRDARDMSSKTRHIITP
jgi:hypothetical protein